VTSLGLLYHGSLPLFLFLFVSLLYPNFLNERSSNRPPFCPFLKVSSLGSEYLMAFILPVFLSVYCCVSLLSILYSFISVVDYPPKGYLICFSVEETLLPVLLFLRSFVVTFRSSPFFAPSYFAPFLLSGYGLFFRSCPTQSLVLKMLLQPFFYCFLLLLVFACWCPNSLLLLPFLPISRSFLGLPSVIPRSMFLLSELLSSTPS